MSGDNGRLTSALPFREALRRIRVTQFGSVEVNDAQLYAMLYLDFAQLMHHWLPKTVLREIVGDAFGQEDVTGVS